MTDIIVSRLPSTAKMPKLLFVLRAILKKHAGVINKFWITEISEVGRKGLKEATISFSSYEEAAQAAECLNGYLYRCDGENKSNKLDARIIGMARRRSPSPVHGRYSRYSRSRSRGSYGRYSPMRERSRSPLFREKSKLDLELELLRKKRLVIEEERRLLLEQKKLDLIREYGVSASKEIERSRERSRDRHVRPKREAPVRPKREAPVHPAQEPRARRQRARPPPSDRLPKFVLPCRLIMAQMKELVKQHTAELTPGETAMLNKLLHTELRKRILLELEDKDYLPSNEIVKVYRNKHPKETDEQLIKTTLNVIQTSYWNLHNDKLDKKGQAKKIAEKKEDPEKKQVESVADNAVTGTPDVKKEPKVVPEPKPVPAPQPVLAPQPVPAPQTKPEPQSKAEPKSEPQATADFSPEPIKVIKVEVKEELKKENVSVTEAQLEDADDWIQDGIDWNDEESEEGQEQTTTEVTN